MDVEFFEKTQSQVQALHEEMGALAKSKPDNPINKFKLKIINEKLKDANTLLTGEFKPFADFEIFDDADMPTSSDVVIILSQYLQCLEGWRSANVEYDDTNYRWYWKTDDGEMIKAQEPTRSRTRKEDTRKRGASRT